MNSPDFPTKVFRAWRVRPPADPNFRASVWLRIEQERRSRSWPAFLHTKAATFAVLLVVTIGGAGWIGRSIAQARVNTDRARLAAVYVASLDARVQARHWE